MDMKEKLRKVQAEKAIKVSLERDVENKKREISNAEWELSNVKAEIVNLKEELELAKKIAVIIMNDYGRIPEKMENLWERNPEFTSLMKENQVINNRRRIAEFEAKLKVADNKIFSTEKNLLELKVSLKMVEEEMKEDE